MSSQSEIESTLSTFYEIISGDKTKKRDWDLMRSLFFVGALLFPNFVTNNPEASHGIEIDTYIQNLDRYLNQNNFFEKGTITQIIVKNNIASVVSTYEARITKDDNQPIKHGVNFVHFLHTESGWKITSMIWRDL